MLICHRDAVVAFCLLVHEADSIRMMEQSASLSAPPTFRDGLAPCPVCDAAPIEAPLLFVKQHAHFVRCRRCRFEFINPRPTDQWIAERYRSYGQSYFTEPSKLQSDFSPGRYSSELRLLAPHQGTLLDVGCATGAFVAAAGEAGFDASGIDLSADATRHGREVRGLPLDSGNLYEQGYGAERFEVVTLWATLEHLTDPGRFLAEANRLLRQGGRLAVSVPNHAGISQRIAGRRNRYVGIDHVNYFTPATGRRILGRYGFVPYRVATKKFNPLVLWHDIRGATPDGATVAQQLTQQQATDQWKQGTGIRRLGRAAHRGVVGLLGAAGLGDVLYLVARKERGR